MLAAEVGESPDGPRFLPPEPGGPEPNLGPPPAPAPAGWQPPTYAQQQTPASGQQPTQWGWQAQPQEPENGPAVAGFVLSLVGAGLLVITVGVSSIVSVVCSALGIYYGQKGKQRVASGETTKNLSLAQAGFVVGIVSVIISALATAFWGLVLIAYVTDEEVRDDIQQEFEDDETVVMVTLARVAARLATSLLA